MDSSNNVQLGSLAVCARNVGYRYKSWWSNIKITHPKFNSSPLKNGAWKTTFLLLGRQLFRGYVKLRGALSENPWQPNLPTDQSVPWKSLQTPLTAGKLDYFPSSRSNRASYTFWKQTVPSYPSLHLQIRRTAWFYLCRYLTPKRSDLKTLSFFGPIDLAACKTTNIVLQPLGKSPNLGFWPAQFQGFCPCSLSRSSYPNPPKV